MQTTQLLPGGLGTARTSLMRICEDSAAAVGALWIGRHPNRAYSAYIYDFEIHESRRGEGLGRPAMTAAEDLVRKVGCARSN